VIADPFGLPPVAAAVLDDPPDPERAFVTAKGLSYATRSWGDPAAPPLLLIHGVTSTSAIWWRVGPALAAALDRRAVALDQAGHGGTTGWLGHHRFRDNADDLLRVVDAAGLRGPDLGVVGHSWGGMTAAWFPALGLATEALVLLDPPSMPVAVMETMLDDPIERHYDTAAEAIDALGPLNPTWGYGDVAAKAEGLASFDVGAVRDVLLENGDWDGGLAALSEPAAAGAAVRWVRGDPLAGGLVTEEAPVDPRSVYAAGSVVMIPGGLHSPMRTKPEATTAALLRALEP